MSHRNQRHHRLALIASFLVLAASHVLGQTHANLEKGFAADKMYQFGDVDHVNVYNGNVALTIPIGGALPVSDRLSFSLTLMYNGKCWTSKLKDAYLLGEDPVHQNLPFYTPDRRSNAGLGWAVSLGRLIDPTETDINNDLPGFLYESPDGGDRSFSPTLHDHAPGNGSEPVVTDVQYSRDNSYLRLSVVPNSTNRLLESPDGTIREFQRYDDGPDIHRWHLISIRDRFGNHIEIDYTTASQWRITDQYGRLTIVHFADRGTSVGAPYRNVVSSIEVPQTVSGRATYTFNYDDKAVATGVCAGRVHPDSPDAYVVPLLSSVTLPDGSTYAFTYTGPIADSIAQLNFNSDECLAGTLASATLPTKGTISYVYQRYELPTEVCKEDVLRTSSGLKTRILHDPLNSAIDQTWDYALSTHGAPNQGNITCPANEKNSGTYNVPPPPAHSTSTVTVTSGSGNTLTVEQKTRYHFSIWPRFTETGVDGTTARDFGLPFRRDFTSSGHSTTRYLSTEVLGADDTPLRSTYVTYDYDYGGPSKVDSNRRLSGTKTVFHDDSGHYIDTESSDFDGVGHYRVTRTSSDLPPAVDRIVTTAYNVRDSAINASALETGTYDSSGTGGTFAPPLSTAPWVLNLHSKITTQEGTASAVQEFCFNPSNGFLRGTLTRGGAERARTDLIAKFTSADSNGVRGALTAETYYGGDLTPLNEGVPDGELCSSLAAPGTAGFDIHHTYAFGVRSTSEYFKANGTGVGFKVLDRDIDSPTGLTTHSRDAAGIDTAFTYDSSRRVVTAKTGTDATINYEYTPATASSRAEVKVSQASATSGTPAIAFKYDGFGRVILQSRSLPSVQAGVARWARQSVAYDAMGRRSVVSEWQEAETPSHFTVFSEFDRFGRPGKIQKPDLKNTTFVYHGIRQVDRTSRIRTTSSGPDTDVLTKEISDRDGRLVQLLELDDKLTSAYTYDIGGRLQKVEMTDSRDLSDVHTQTRTFNYDNRGFLLSEAHPELGASGNGTTAYQNYDARGHAHRKWMGVENGIYDVRLTYDESERLTDVHDTGGGRLLKHFEFGADNLPVSSPTNFQRGKLVTAQRANHLAGGDVLVTETYKYEHPSGRASERQTVVTSSGNTLQSFNQLFQYDDLGSLTAPGYPTCDATVTCSGMSGLTAATFQYKDGSLVAVPNHATSISYLGNMTSQVVHHNGVTDTYNQDTNGMPRPSSIAISGWSENCPPPAAPAITAATSVCAGSSGNAASVPAVSGVQYEWSITGGSIPGSRFGNSITYTAGTSGSVVLSAIGTNSCGQGSAGTRSVSILALPTATVSGSGPLVNGSRQIQGALTGTGPWSVTWSDGVTLGASSSPQTRIVTIAGTYTVTAVSDANCSNVGSGSAVVGMPAPASFTATTQDSDTLDVLLQWSAVSGASGYRIERTTCLTGCGWSPLLPNPISALSYTDHVTANSVPVTYLYRVTATANGVPDSPPSALDFATTATLLFSESIVGGTTVVTGNHIRELRLAMDALRYAAGLQAYMTPAYADGWANYNAPTGLILAGHVRAMRTAYAEALLSLTGAQATFSGEAPTEGRPIFAYQFNQLRTGVK